MQINEITKSEDNNLSTERALIAKVKKNPTYIRYLSDPSNAVQLAAVTKDGRVIYYIDGPSEEIQLAAVKHSVFGDAFLSIAHPTAKVIKAAINKNSNFIFDLENPPKGLFEEYKTEIIKCILKDVQDLNFLDANQKIYRLESYNINWPELKIIKKSIAAVGYEDMI
jgi:hypothetical protein